MRHYPLAVVELIGYLIGWAVVVNILLNEVNPVERFLPLVLFLIFSHGVDATLTYYVAKKGLHLKKSPVTGHL